MEKTDDCAIFFKDDPSCTYFQHSYSPSQSPCGCKYKDPGLRMWNILVQIRILLSTFQVRTKVVEVLVNDGSLKLFGFKW
jgi:hypothetical protein